jgi:KDO2-lipid IV(A) lauroyltransferase
MADGRPFARRLRHALEAAAVYPLFALFRLLPLPLASAIGGGLGRLVGPYLMTTRIARRNLAAAFPAKDAMAIERIIRGMWDNLGRVAAEYPHMLGLRIYEPASPVEVVGAEIVDRLAADGKPAVLFTGHIANWEITRACLLQRGLDIVAVYRAANNPWIDRLLLHGRDDLKGGLFPKGSTGARASLAAMKEGKHLCVLVDQKMNDGIAAPFFSRTAMTVGAPVELARRFDCPLVPVRAERLDGARFRVTVMEPMTLERGDDRHADVRAGVAQMNLVLEGWIRERPEQWLWVHRRWD